MNRFGTLIRSRRLERNMSYTELSLAIKRNGGTAISKSLLSLLESNIRVPVLSTAYDLARALDLEMETVLAVAFEARIEHSCNREYEALGKLIKRKRLGRKLDVSRITSGMQDHSKSI